VSTNKNCKCVAHIKIQNCRKKGFERPGYYIDGSAPVQKYDWYGYYGREKNTNTSYEEKLKGDYKFEFSDYHDLVCINFSLFSLHASNILQYISFLTAISFRFFCAYKSRLATKLDCVVRMLSCSI
jgi:hypothetical protein